MIGYGQWLAGTMRAYETYAAVNNKGKTSSINCVEFLSFHLFLFYLLIHTTEAISLRLV
jgi:hypothetical protein